MRLLLPKTFIITIKGPLYFLIGPIKGGDDWQHQACLGLERENGDNTTIVNPYRYTGDHPLFPFKVTGEENRFERQTDWERFYIEMAGTSVHRPSCILAWLTCESKVNPRTDGDPYARDTYGELGEIRGDMKHNPGLNFVLGAEPDFPGLRVIQRNFNKALGKEFKIHSTLEETIQAAVEKAYS